MLSRPTRACPRLMDRETVKAIESAGLTYLVHTQRQDGSWLNSGGYGTYPQVMTSLSAVPMANGSIRPSRASTPSTSARR